MGSENCLAKRWYELVRLDLMSASGKFFDILTNELINTHPYI